MSQSEKGLIGEYNRLFVIVSRSVEHYKHARKNFMAVNEKFISMRKLLMAEQKNFEKAKAHNPNSPRIAIIDVEMKKLISNLNALKPELQRKHRIAKQAHNDVKMNRQKFEAVEEKVLSDARNQSQIGSLKKPEEIQAFDVSSFNMPEDFSFKTGSTSENSSAVLLKEVLEARDLFVNAETKESECRWGLKNLKQELDLINEALSSTSRHSDGKRYKSIEKLRTTLENSEEKLKQLIEENYEMKLNSMDTFKELRQRYYEATREVIEFPDSIDARDWLRKDTENRLQIVDIVNDFLSNPEGDDTQEDQGTLETIDEENLENVDEGYQASGDEVEHEEYFPSFNLHEEDFPSFNLHKDFTNKDYSQMLKSKLESTRLSFSRRSNLGSIGRQEAIEDTDFLEFNLDGDNTNREHSKMLKSKLEASKLSLSRKNSFQTLGQRVEMEDLIENFSDIDLDSKESVEIDELLGDDVGDEYISQFDQINVMESTRIGDHGAGSKDFGDDEQEIQTSDQESLNVVMDDQEVLRQMDSYRQLLDKGIFNITRFNENLASHGRQIEEALKKLTDIEKEVKTAEMDYKIALLDFERNVSKLMDLGVNILANEEKFRKTTVDLAKLWLVRADKQAHQIEEWKKFVKWD